MATAIQTKAEMTEAEWAARQELAACYRVFDYLGWTELIYNHITLKVPGEDSAFLINPFGLHFSEVTASNLVKIDLDGNKLAESSWGVNLAGFVQHSAIHRALPHIHCVMHTHTTAGQAVAASKAQLSTANFTGAHLAGQVAYHDFEGVTVRPDEGPRLVANLGNKPLMILRNHGLLSVGPTLHYAFIYLWMLQRSCEIQLAGAALGPTLELPEDVIAVHQLDNAKVTENVGGMGIADFAALVRLVDRRDRSWRD